MCLGKPTPLERHKEAKKDQDRAHKNKRERERERDANNQIPRERGARNVKRH